MFDNRAAQLPVPMTDGSWINEETARTIEIIHETWPMLEVRWIPRDKREPGDAAFAIIERTNGMETVAFYVQNEDEMNRSILERIYKADNNRHNPHDRDNQLKAHSQAMRAMRQKEIDDMMEDRKAEAVHRLKKLS